MNFGHLLQGGDFEGAPFALLGHSLGCQLMAEAGWIQKAGEFCTLHGQSWENHHTFAPYSRLKWAQVCDSDELLSIHSWERYAGWDRGNQIWVRMATAILGVVSECSWWLWIFLEMTTYLWMSLDRCVSCTFTLWVGHLALGCHFHVDISNFFLRHLWCWDVG